MGQIRSIKLLFWILSIHIFAAVTISNSSANALFINPAGNVGIGTDTPSAKLEIAGVPGTDGIKFPDGTLQTTAITQADTNATVPGKIWKRRIFTTSGTWICPGENTLVHVVAIGGGGGGGGVCKNYQYPNANGHAGGTSAFGSLVSASGGGGGGASHGKNFGIPTSTTSSYETRVNGGNGGNIGSSSYVFCLGNTLIVEFGRGGKGFMGFGSGGDGGLPFRDQSVMYAPAGGGGSGYIKDYAGQVSTNQTIIVGAGGNGGQYQNQGTYWDIRGNNGSQGVVIVEWLETI